MTVDRVQKVKEFLATVCMDEFVKDLLTRKEPKGTQVPENPTVLTQENAHGIHNRTQRSSCNCS